MLQKKTKKYRYKDPCMVLVENHPKIDCPYKEKNAKSFRCGCTGHIKLHYNTRMIGKWHKHGALNSLSASKIVTTTNRNM